MAVYRTHPKVTLGLICYNHERFIADAIDGALNQTYSPLEIVISDDSSTDDTFAIAREVVGAYTGPHAVLLQRTSENLGIVGHINQLMERASGDLVVYACGDDVSVPHRVERIVGEYLQSGQKAMSIHSNVMVIDRNGQELGLLRDPDDSTQVTLEQLAHQGMGVLGCSHAWSREVFDRFGPLPMTLTQEDYEIPFRAALLGHVHYISEPLVRYRLHENNYVLTDSRDITDASHFLRLVGRYTPGRLATSESYLRDLELANTIFPDRAAELSRLSEIVGGNRADFEIELGLFDASYMTRICTIWNAAWHGQTRMRRLARWTLWFLVPGPYLWARQTRTSITRFLAPLLQHEVRRWTP